MSILGKCPKGPALPDIPVSTCPEGFGQIQKLVFQRLYSAVGVANAFDATTKMPTKKASWTPLLSAADSTKVVCSPYVQAPTSEPGAPRTFGGGNETLGGIEVIVGRDPSSFNGVFREMPQAVIKALKGLEGEQLGVFLVDENGYMGMLADNPTTPTKYTPVPIYSLFVGDKMLGGFEAPDSNAIQFKFMPNWSDNLVMVKPEDFNALTDLVKTA